jgi:hypothetical protein
MRRGLVGLGTAVGVAAFAGMLGAWSTGLPATTEGGQAVEDWMPTATKAGFALRFRGEQSRYRVNTVSVMPGAALALGVAGPIAAERVRIRQVGGTLTQEQRAQWKWHAPEVPGLYPLVVSDGDNDSIRLNVFVLVPFDRVRGEHLNGYRIGSYPERPLRGLAIYQRPLGFIEVTPENAGTLVSPHFRLEQFLGKQEGDFPKYLVLRPRLLLKLEYLLERAQASGIEASSFYVMSGYRTPYYNRQIRNVRYSRHLWGGAADIFVDERPRDGEMDDLNGDGRSDVEDAVVLYDIIERASAEPSYQPFVGGLARYGRTSRHGPFVHVDVRGTKARW